MLRCIRNVRAISTRHAIFSKTIEEPTVQKLSQQTNTLVRSPLHFSPLQVKVIAPLFTLCHRLEVSHERAIFAIFRHV